MEVFVPSFQWYSLQPSLSKWRPSPVFRQWAVVPVSKQMSVVVLWLSVAVPFNGGRDSQVLLFCGLAEKEEVL